MSERSLWVDLRMIVASWPEDAPRGAVKRFCEQHGVSSSWFHKVRARAREGEGTLTSTLPRSRAPHTSPRSTPAGIEDLALRIRKELAADGWDHGPLSVRARMLAMDPDFPVPSRSTLAEIFHRRGAVTPQPQKRPRSSWRRFTFPRPNACWQLDGMDWALADGRRVCILQVIDDHSRLIVASRAALSENATDALTVLQTGIERHGIPTHLLSDNSVAFNASRRGRVSRVQAHLGALGVVLIAARPNHPQTCGKNERAHQTLQRWLRARPPTRSLAELQELLDTFDRLYNTERPHQGIGGRTPATAYAATPKDPTPTPPQTQPDPTPRSQTRLRSIAVDDKGYVRIDRLIINIGVAHTGRVFHLARHGDHLAIYTTDGTHYRDITITPGRLYYGNGQPRGGTRQPRLKSTKSSDT
jgi:transposase InsO family protein